MSLPAAQHSTAQHEQSKLGSMSRAKTAVKVVPGRTIKDTKASDLARGIAAIRRERMELAVHLNGKRRVGCCMKVLAGGWLAGWAA